MREEIRRIHAETRITTIYVTHDQKEALSLAGRMSVLRLGRIEQTGDPRTVYRSPANRFVADFIGETNWLEARVLESSPAGLKLQTSEGVLEAPARPELAPGAPVQAGFRPEAVEIGEGRVNAMETRIQHVSYLGEIEQYRLELPGGRCGEGFRAESQGNSQGRRPAAGACAAGEHDGAGRGGGGGLSSWGKLSCDRVAFAASLK